MFGKNKVAIMGTGRIAGIMADTIKSMRGVTCYAVGSRTQENANRFASEHGIKKACPGRGYNLPLLLSLRTKLSLYIEGTYPG